MTGKILSAENVAEIIIGAPILRPPVFIEEFRIPVAGAVERRVEWHVFEEVLGGVHTVLLHSSDKQPVMSSGVWEDVLFVDCPDLPELTGGLLPQSVLVVVKARAGRNKPPKYVVSADAVSTLAAGLSEFDKSTAIGRRVVAWFEANSVKRAVEEEKAAEDEKEDE